MELLIVGGTDMTAKITKYELTDDEPAKVSEIQMADGTSLIRLAPYTKTEMNVTFSNLTGTEYAELRRMFTDNEAILSYYSEKTNSMKTGTFFLEPSSYSVKKKTLKKDLLHDVSMTLKKTR